MRWNPPEWIMNLYEYCTVCEFYRITLTSGPRKFNHIAHILIGICIYVIFWNGVALRLKEMFLYTLQDFYEQRFYELATSRQFLFSFIQYLFHIILLQKIIYLILGQ